MFLEKIKQLRKCKKRKFEQSVELIINTKGFDPRKESFVIFARIPHQIKKKRICAFLENATHAALFEKCITKREFEEWKEKKKIKKLVKSHDAFVASASVMPAVALTFGKFLGPAGKMPSQKIGIITKEDEKTLKEEIEKINKSIVVKVKEASIKVVVGKESMSDEEIAENAEAFYSAALAALPKKNENIKNIFLRLTMSKPV